MSDSAIDEVSDEVSCWRSVLEVCGCVTVRVVWVCDSSVGYDVSPVAVSEVEVRFDCCLFAIGCKWSS